MSGWENRTAAGGSSAPLGAFLPPGWNAQWTAARNAARGGQGTASILVAGDSVAAGQGAPTTQFDALLKGWVGRLDQLLTPQLGAFAEGYTAGGVAPVGITGAPLTSPSGPYGNFGANTPTDGPFGQSFSASPIGGTWEIITAKAHPVTGAFPTKVDLLTVDGVVAGQFSWQIDAGAVNTVTTVNGTGVTGNGSLRRTTINLDGLSTHTITLVNVNANGLLFVGHVAYYGATGLGIFRAVNPGFRGVDFATGPGATAGQGGNPSVTPDHWQPITGINNAYNTIGGTFPARPDLLIMALGGDDAVFGASTSYLRRAISRVVQAARTGVPASSGSPGASVLFLASPGFDPYSDNYSAVGAAQSGVSFEASKFGAVLADVANAYGCGVLSLGPYFGQTPVARGLQQAGFVHPTQSNGAALGADGHSLIAQAVNGVLSL